LAHSVAGVVGVSAVHQRTTRLRVSRVAAAAALVKQAAAQASLVQGK
jgi:hypothetical protein